MDRTLGEVLEQLRTELSLSLREAAQRSGLSYTYIRDIERGYNRSTKAPIKPTPETLQRLAKAYNYSYDELMQMAGYIEGSTESADNIDPELLEVLSQLSEEQQRRILERLSRTDIESTTASGERFFGEFESHPSLTPDELKYRYRLEIEGEEASPEEIEEAVAFIKVKRMMKSEK